MTTAASRAAAVRESGDNLKNEENLKNEDYLEYYDYLKISDFLRNEIDINYERCPIFRKFLWLPFHILEAVQ